MPNLSAICRAQVVLPAPWGPSKHTRKGGAYRKKQEFFVTIYRAYSAPPTVFHFQNIFIKIKSKTVT